MTIIGMFAFEHVIISSFDFTDIFFLIHLLQHWISLNSHKILRHRQEYYTFSSAFHIPPYCSILFLGNSNTKLYYCLAVLSCILSRTNHFNHI